MTAELEALQAVGQALANLGNPESRQRVLSWASARFQLEPLVGVPAIAVGVAEAAAIVTEPEGELSLEGVADLFDEHDEFDADEDLVVQPTALVAAVAEDPGLGSLLDGLVADFQRIALECQAV